MDSTSASSKARIETCRVLVFAATCVRVIGWSHTQAMSHLRKRHQPGCAELFRQVGSKMGRLGTSLNALGNARDWPELIGGIASRFLDMQDDRPRDLRAKYIACMNQRQRVRDLGDMAMPLLS
jgi:hypothetical protein